MNLIRKVILFMALITICFMREQVWAANSFPDTIEAIRGEHLEFSSVGMAYKHTNDNIDLYCVEWKKIGPTGTISLMSEQYNPGVSAGLASIINTVMDGNKEQYYYASIAIHLYTESDYLNSGITEADISRVQSLVNKAKSIENDVNTFDVNASVGSRILTQTDDYFVSEVVKVDKKNANDFSVVLNNDKAEVINKTENSFQIRIHKDNIPTNGVFNLDATIHVTQTYSTVAKYVPSDNENYQMIIPDIILPAKQTKSTNLTFVANKTGILVAKTNEDGKTISGAGLQILDKDGNEIRDENGKVLYSWVSTNEPRYIEGLSAGHYILREIGTPKGYLPLDQDIGFIIAIDGDITLIGNNDIASTKPRTLIISNKKTKLEISKQDTTNGQELPGATLQILDNDGNEIKDTDGNTLYKWKSTNKPHYIEEIPIGKYILVEIIAPNGYVLNQEKIEFEITNTDEIVSVVMKNTPIVDVPATGFNTSRFVLVMGLIAIISGSIFIGLNAKKQN